jgi:hydroxymethylpyrimidine pyrophosphatase-like HAD family hydrolase
MRYYALACDFDGTIAWNGQVDHATVASLRRVRDSGRRLILVTGRELDDLIDRFPTLALFDRVVAENGAIIYRPETNDQRMLGDPPPPAFIEDLRRRGVAPISVGDVIVATSHPHESAVLDTIEQHGLEHHVVFNKGAVMVLPAGLNKATGLVAALNELRLSPRNTVCIGDAENDQEMFRTCELSVAVNNALATVKTNADIVTEGHHGAGVIELADQLVSDDLRTFEHRLHRHDILLGHGDDGNPVFIHPHDTRVLLAGAPASGKSMLATGIVERLVAHGYQVCVVDPEGDYGTVPDIIHVGDGRQAPSVDEVAQLLEYPSHSVVANLLGLPFIDRPAFLMQMCDVLHRLRNRTGRPHWLVVDEAHHLLPQHESPSCCALLSETPGLVLITVDPMHLAPGAVRAANMVIATGTEAALAMHSFAEIQQVSLPGQQQDALTIGEAVIWDPSRDGCPVQFSTTPCQSLHRRHRRKYAEGDMGWDRSFYFTGPDGQHHLRAQNLIVFMDIADRIDDATWLYHAQRGDYSRWIRDAIGDSELADHVVEIEALQAVPIEERRIQLRREIEHRYTLQV